MDTGIVLGGSGTRPVICPLASVVTNSKFQIKVAIADVRSNNRTPSAISGCESAGL